MGTWAATVGGRDGGVIPRSMSRARPPTHGRDGTGSSAPATYDDAHDGLRVPRPYEDLLRLVLETGTPKADRTGTGTRSVFGHQMRFDLSAGFPLVTTKRVHLRSIVHELLWFLRGESNVALPAREQRDHLGRVGRSPTASSARSTACSGAAGRRPTAATSTRSPSCWPTCAATPTRAGTSSRRGTSPTSRRWRSRRATRSSSSTSPTAGSPASSTSASADLFLGVPFNIASYALLTHMVAQQVGLEVGDFVWTGGDCHIYDNHVDQVREQLSRDAVPARRRCELRQADSLFDYTFDDVEVRRLPVPPGHQGPGGRVSLALVWAQTPTGDHRARRHAAVAHPRGPGALPRRSRAGTR